ncbi:Prolyl 3 [Escovopsis weberi]|uniref:uS12 prolyl 3,4-dihydroxylase n=1 Tax=Escovopsis weberi TaxID=150374 RepID=A0A0N0RSS8_ESCWE|nr:Prolyl 3 [Escovopsis weberi]
MKRKAESRANGAGTKKSKTSLSPEDAKRRFRGGLFDEGVLDAYTHEYAASSPYKHAVIHELVDDTLLRSVRDEIRDNVHFTPKETDIYKIHQSGDLANLDGLDDESLAKLPSLLALRDAIYSETFRNYVSHITGCGPLSGRKTDMAINVYTPGCFLLCHDDVIGSRRVSYILYLTDPDTPWKPEWGGALRLFPVQEMRGGEGKGDGDGDGNGNGEVARTPIPDAVKSIPPAWNQLSFFAVQPGESFHDVEEVYHAESAAQLAQDGGRVRMAISGWFHIPQAGEDGFVEGEEELNATNSSLMQLRGNPAQYDTPQARPVAVAGAGVGEGEGEGEGEADFEEADLEFLLRYLAPTYLTPDTLEQVSQVFEEESSITLGDVLCRRFAQRLREWIAAQERAGLPDDSAAIEKVSRWRVARPPHKHRYLYRRAADAGGPEGEGKGKGKEKQREEESPLDELLNVLLPSRQFRHWLQVATGCTVESQDILARRFRRGRDYTLATGHDGKPRLELTLGLTPTPGWGDAAEEEEEEVEGEKDDDDDDDDDDHNGGDAGKAKGKDKGKAVAQEEEEEDAAGAEVGGHEVYMAGDDDAHEDAAIYKSSGEDDNILFFQAAAWNKMSIVLRDSGALKFVKYVSRRAPGDRWDVAGVFGIEDVEGERFEEKGIQAEKEERAEELHAFEDAEQDEDEDEEDEDEDEDDDDEEEEEDGDDGDEFEGLSD